MTLADPEVLPAPAKHPRVVHACCGYTLVGARANFGRGTEAFCGEPISLPLIRREEDDLCLDCGAHALTHATKCDCFKLWPNGRLPRRER